MTDKEKIEKTIKLLWDKNGAVMMATIYLNTKCNSEFIPNVFTALKYEVDKTDFLTSTDIADVEFQKKVMRGIARTWNAYMSSYKGACRTMKFNENTDRLTGK